MKQQDTLTPYFYTIIGISALTVILLVSASADMDWSLAWVFCGFLLYIPLIFSKNRIFRGIVIAIEYLFLLSVFWLFIILLKYEPGEELIPLALFMAHSSLRLFLFLKILGSRYAPLLAIVFALLISVLIYWHGSSEYLKLM